MVTSRGQIDKKASRCGEGRAGQVDRARRSSLPFSRENGGKVEDKRTCPYHQLASLSSNRFVFSLLSPLLFLEATPGHPSEFSSSSNFCIYWPTFLFLYFKLPSIGLKFDSGVGALNCMTSASELFYSRRSRLGRAAPPPDFVGVELTDDRNLNYISNRRHHHHRHDPDVCDPLRRAPQSRHISHRVYRPVSLVLYLFLLDFVCLVVQEWRNQTNCCVFPFTFEISRFSDSGHLELGFDTKISYLFGFLEN